MSQWHFAQISPELHRVCHKFGWKEGHLIPSDSHKISPLQLHTYWSMIVASPKSQS